MERFEWDEAKDTANRAKHGFGFELVYDFDWRGAVYRTDDRQDYRETRRLPMARPAAAHSQLFLWCGAAASGSSV